MKTRPQTIAEHSTDLIRQALDRMGLRPDKEWSWNPSSSFPTREYAPKADVIGNVLRGGTPEQLDRAAKALGKRVSDIDHLGVAAVEEAVRAAHEPIRITVRVFADSPVTAEMRSAMQRRLLNKADKLDSIREPSLANALREKAESLNDIKTIGKLDEMKVFANKELDAFNSLKSEGKVIAADAKQVAVTREFANAIKSELYPELERLGGPELAPYLERESFLIQARDGIHDAYYSVVAPAHANRLRTSHLEYILEGPHTPGVNRYAERLNNRSLFARAIGLFRSSAGEFNLTFRKGVGRMGGGAIPERFNIAPSERKLLASGGPEFQFVIAGRPDIPKITGLKEAQAELQRLRARQVKARPQDSHQLATLVDELENQIYKYEAGMRSDEFAFTIKPEKLTEETTAGLISQTPRKEWMSGVYQIDPNQMYTGPLTDAAKVDPRLPSTYRPTPTQADIQASQVGPNAIPDRSFTGPATTGETNWQYIGEMADDPKSASISGGGVLITNDVKAVKSVLHNIAQRMDMLKRSASPKAKGEIGRLMEIQADLAVQLQKYNAYRNSPVPSSIKVDPGRPGMVNRANVPGGVLTGAATTAAVGRGEP